MNNNPNAFGPTLAGMRQKLRMIEAISSNIANVNSIGYQRQIPESVTFKSILSDVSNESVARDMTSGQFKKTGSNFDLAIEGNAYFLVESPKGIVPTKNGNFRLNEKGELCTQDGQEVVIVEKTDTPLSLAKSFNIEVKTNGEIFIGTERYGRIAMQINDNRPVKIHQGFLEGSNVNLMNEMVALSQTFRAFEANEKILGMEASVDKELVEKYGRNV